MTSRQKAKGNSFERELVAEAQAAGIEAKRAYASNGESLGLHAEVDCLIGSRRVGAKRRRLVPAWLSLTDNVDAVAIRADRGDTVVLIRWQDYLKLLCGINDVGGGN